MSLDPTAPPFQAVSLQQEAGTSRFPRLGVIILAHTALARVVEVARFWAAGGAEVALHLDARVPASEVANVRGRLSDLPRIRFVPQRRCEWGTWGIVAAMQEAAELLLAETDVTHVYAASGACLPLRPVQDLCRYLERWQGTDFIESVCLDEVNWPKGGLSLERFTLYHPVGYKRSKWLFDRLVDLQRAFGVKRRLPDGIVLHLGSQWWCLTRKTLSRILTDPERPKLERFFRTTWIPDESWFQTLARRHSERIESRSLTLSKFDHAGRPHLFYDDHLQLLERSACFVARKIWPGADRLYAHFLAPRPASDAEPDPARVDRHFARVTEQRLRGRPGLYMMGRFPAPARAGDRSAGPYAVFIGFADLFPTFREWLSALGGLRVHGRLYAPHGAEFAGGETVFAGGLSASAPLRNYNPVAFLTNLIWATRGEVQAFLLHPEDQMGQHLDLIHFMASDRNARIAHIAGAWTVPLSQRFAEAPCAFPELRKLAAAWQKSELAMLDILRGPQAVAEIKTWSLAEFLEDPVAPFQAVLKSLAPFLAQRPDRLPHMTERTALARFLQALRNAGMAPQVMGDIPASDSPEHAGPRAQNRPSGHEGRG